MAMRRNGRDDDFSFEIKDRFGIVSEDSNGWTKELNLVSWNGTTPKYDIRGWSPDHSRMTKGMTFSREEMSKIKEFLMKAM